MSLLVRSVVETGTGGRKILRSVGDPPNGIVVFCSPDPDRMGFWVDPGWETPTDLAKCGGILKQTDEGIPTNGTPIDLEQLVDALEDREAARALLGLTMLHVAHMSQIYAAHLQFDFVEGLGRIGRLTVEALSAAGHLHQQEGEAA